MRTAIGGWGAALVLGLACGSAGTPEGAGPSSPSGDRSDSLGSISPRSPVAELFVPGDNELSVLTFNINFGVGHDPRNISVVDEIDADLVLLQETTVESEAAFREVLSERYPHILFRDCCNAGGLGVLSKYPIAEQLYLEPNVGWFPAWRVVIDTPLGAVQALNVHLRPPMSDNGSWVGGYFSTREIRGEEMADLWMAMGSDMATIVAGDFNENAKGQAVEFLAGQGLRSALPQMQPRAKTWRWPTKVGEIRAMLDHVVYSDAFELRSAAVVDGGRSDHFPVVAVFARAP